MEIIDVKTIALIGRHTPGGRMRLFEKPQLFEVRHDIANRCRRYRNRSASKSSVNQPAHLYE